MKIHFKVNGVPAEVEASPDEMLLEVLRRDLGLRSVRATCGVGICGACTALVNGEPVSTCIFLAPLAEGCEITTAEGMGGDHPVQRAFEEEHAFQCGYCTPGMLLTVKALLEENPGPSDEEIKVALGGNLCRCGCYLKIINAAKRAAAAYASGTAPARQASMGAGWSARELEEADEASYIRRGERSPRGSA